MPVKTMVMDCDVLPFWRHDLHHVNVIRNLGIAEVALFLPGGVPVGAEDAEMPADFGTFSRSGQNDLALAHLVEPVSHELPDVLWFHLLLDPLESPLGGLGLAT